MPKPENTTGKPDHANGKHKLTMNLPAETWQALEDHAAAQGIEPKELVKRLINQSLGLPDQPDDDDGASAGS
jgi:hypothetical protein